MGFAVRSGAICSCSCALAPMTISLKVTSNFKDKAVAPLATAMDNAPIVNISPKSAMCTSTTNPEVSSATAAAFGVLTPMPCVPSTTGQWSNVSSKVFIGNKPALTSSSTIKCAYGGLISIVNAGQIKAKLP